MKEEVWNQRQLGLSMLQVVSLGAAPQTSWLSVTYSSTGIIPRREGEGRKGRRKGNNAGERKQENGRERSGREKNGSEMERRRREVEGE